MFVCDAMFDRDATFRARCDVCDGSRAVRCSCAMRFFVCDAICLKRHLCFRLWERRPSIAHASMLWSTKLPLATYYVYTSIQKMSSCYSDQPILHAVAIAGT